MLNRNLLTSVSNQMYRTHKIFFTPGSLQNNICVTCAKISQCYREAGCDSDCRVNKKTKTLYLKGIGHAILGNFSTDQMVIELTKISHKQLKTVEDL